jgi:uncharacterized membrane protein YbhN (UPF0104 family)
MKARLIGFGRILAFALLAGLTYYGFREFVGGDWPDVLAFWQQHGGIIPLLLALSIMDVVLEMIAWMWVYQRVGIKVWDKSGCLAFLTGRAGLILPAQLGRLMRPDAIVRLERARLAEALKAEGLVFVFDGISVVTLLASLLVFTWSPLLAPFVALAIVAFSLLLGNGLSQLVRHTSLGVPSSFMWSWPSFLTVGIMAAGWLIHGTAFHVVVADLPGNMTLWDSLFFSQGSAVLGVASGLPGGIGATEGLLGASLDMRGVPVEFLVVAVAAFRLITFWIWIPIGWLALVFLKRGRDNVAVPDEDVIETEVAK